MSETQYWLCKSEPYDYSIDDLQRDGKTPWDGVRNYQARNFMRDVMKVGDPVLYYHSNAKPPGVVGVARVASEPYADALQFDADSKYYDAKSSPDEPRWQLVDLEFVGKFDQIVSLADLKADEGLDGMLVTRKGQRLSIQPVEPQHFQRILEVAGFEFSAD